MSKEKSKKVKIDKDGMAQLNFKVPSHVAQKLVDFVFKINNKKNTVRNITQKEIVCYALENYYNQDQDNKNE